MLSDLYLASSSGRARLRIGLLLDGIHLPRCFYQVAEDIRKSNFADIQLIVTHHLPEQAAEPPPRASLPVRAWRIIRNRRRRRGLFFWWYSQFDSQRNAPGPDPLEEIDAGKLLDGIPRLCVTPLSEGFVHRFPADAIEQIRARNLDVIFRFGFNILRGEILQSARYGIWSFHHGDNQYYRGGPAHFWELVEESPLSGVILQVLTEELDGGHVLCKALFSSEPGSSLVRNRWGPFWGATHMAIRKLHELHQYGWDHVLNNSVPGTPYRGKRKIYRTPDNLEMVRWLAPKIIPKVFTRSFRRPRLQHWRIAVRADGPALQVAAAQGHSQADLTGFQWIESPRGHFWADPFLLEQDGVTWLFFEDYRYHEERGVIGVAPLGNDGSLGQARTCLDLPYHLSFPNVFEHGGEVFMIPETERNKTVELYRATRFPYEWKLEKVLFQGNLVDTSPWFDGRLWWFFAGAAEPEGHVAISLLFCSDSLTGSWTAHPANPISSDVRTARNAGAIFSSGGKLFRPSQDCSGAYGRSVSFHEIITLNRENYAERAVLKMTAPLSSGFSGMHTYNFRGRFEVIDGVKLEPRADYY